MYTNRELSTVIYTRKGIGGSNQIFIKLGPSLQKEIKLANGSFSFLKNFNPSQNVIESDENWLNLSQPD